MNVRKMNTSDLFDFLRLVKKDWHKGRPQRGRL